MRWEGDSVTALEEGLMLCQTNLGNLYGALRVRFLLSADMVLHDEYQRTTIVSLGPSIRETPR